MRTDTGGRRLSGWQRLGIFLAVLYALAVAAFVAVKWPKPENGIRTYWVREEAAGRDIKFEFWGATPSDEQIDAIAAWTSETRSRNDEWLTSSVGDVERVETAGAGPVYFAKGWREQAELAVKRRADGPWDERRAMLVWAMLVWAIPAALVYALVRSVAWVVQGFEG